MTPEEIRDTVRQLKSITHCLYGIGADADSVYQRLDVIENLALIGNRDITCKCPEGTPGEREVWQFCKECKGLQDWD